MFTGKTKNKSRFNLLLLSEDEYYFTDYSAVYYPIDGDDDKAFSRYIHFQTRSKISLLIPSENNNIIFYSL